MNQMRALMQICSPGRRLFEDASGGVPVDVAALNTSLHASAAAMAKSFGLQWDMSWSNKLTEALKAKRGEHVADPQNRNQAYDPIYYVFPCADAIFQSNQLNNVEDQVSDQDGRNPSADYQISLASMLEGIKLYNARELSRIAGGLSRSEANWQRVVSRAGGQATICDTLKVELQRLLPMLLTVIAVLSR